MVISGSGHVILITTYGNSRVANSEGEIGIHCLEASGRVIVILSKATVGDLGFETDPGTAGANATVGHIGGVNAVVTAFTATSAVQGKVVNLETNAANTGALAVFRERGGQAGADTEATGQSGPETVFGVVCGQAIPSGARTIAALGDFVGLQADTGATTVTVAESGAIGGQARAGGTVAIAVLNIILCVQAGASGTASITAGSRCAKNAVATAGCVAVTVLG